jgi:hypothetical protein
VILCCVYIASSAVSREWIIVIRDVCLGNIATTYIIIYPLCVAHFHAVQVALRFLVERVDMDDDNTHQIVTPPYII